MLATLPMRERFHRTSSLLWAPFEPPWIAACAVVLGGSAWLTRYAHRHAGVADEAWWRFALSSEGPRSLRALVGAVALLVLLALYRLIRPMPARVLPPTPDDLERARPIVERSAWTYPNLVYRRDKAVLFGAAGDAFLMYGRQGRSWIAMGDPIGPAGSVAELAWRLRDLADRADGRCVFFEVHDAHRALYADLGLTLTRFGDEARIPLDGFDLASPTRRGLRQARSRLLHAGHRFEILPADAVPALLPELRAVSDAWLAGKRTHEKGFSNASFDPAYLGRFPIALVRDAARVVAFANVWYGADREELSIDLMRHRPGAPNGTMDFLFAELLSHGHALGYRWFNLGVAPLAGLDARQGPSVWRRVGAFVYRHGEHFYNFDGLRRYKEKFAPAWTPVYVASPGGLALAPVLVDVAALIAGGLGGIVSRRAGRRGDAA
jgi:phosphatidylglycerol lysyltransferase